MPEQRSRTALVEDQTTITEKITLCGLPLAELADLLAPLPRYRSAQIFKWIARGVQDIDQMTDIPIPLREELDRRFTVSSGIIENRYDSRDSMKLVLGFPGGITVEAVMLADAKKRLTVCLSTQAGCPLGCVFCKTGSVGFIRNLSAAEIVEQFLFLRRCAAQDGRPGIGNIVVMGMGEPLLNLGELRKAIAVITDPNGMNFSRRRITVSTCGISEGIQELCENGPFVRLALSLVTADEQLRKRLMPAAAGEKLSKIKEALLNFQKAGGGRITLEAVLLGGINTRKEDALSIKEFAGGLDTVVNLIPWNPIEGLNFEGIPLHEPERKEVEKYSAMLESMGLKVTRRMSRGRGIMGACGQLAAGRLTAAAD
ncbi:MAG: 23S rRNA (adenine(2503)-C(2))-methyltransferase RlmN [Treponema sp.]|nr:23S rRNA (adenine(2503)-C(2))-methyltransferase RlmN [Treponema sp.]